MQKYNPFKITFSKNIFFSIFIFLAFSTFNFSHAGKIHGVIKKNNNLYEFENFISANIDNQFSINYKADQREEIKVIYENPNREKKIFSNIQLEKNELFIFPERKKYVKFDNIGLHTITISSIKFSKKINIYVSDEKNNNLFKGNLSKLKKLNSSKKLSSLDLVLTNREPSTNIFESVKSKFSQRSGSKIYKDFSGSVVLVRGDDGIGAGVAIGGGKILTNYHVISNNRNFGITKKPLDLSNENVQSASIYPVKVVSVNKKYDLALLEYDNSIIQIPEIVINHDVSINIGDTVHAIGHPLGEYWTYTQGIISQVRSNYKICLKNQCDSENDHLIADVIQTQTPINPGNSGGPLINENSELVGINTFSRTDSVSLNFAVSISSINKFLKGESYDHKSIQKEYEKESKKELKIIYKFKPYENCTFLQEVKTTIKHIQYFDCNDNKKADLIAIDSNKNSNVDNFIYDNDENGIADMHEEIILVDGIRKKIRTYWSNTKKNKTIETRVDSNGDGKFDEIFYF